MESIVVLCNHLHRLLADHKGTGKAQKPDAAALERLFAAYQKERIPRMKEICDLSGLITKVQAWSSPLHRFLGTWVFPLQPDKAVADLIGELVRSAPKLDYVSDAGFTSGRLAWKDKEQAAKVSLSGNESVSLLVRLLGATAALLVVLQGVRVFAFASASATV